MIVIVIDNLRKPCRQGVAREKRSLWEEQELEYEKKSDGVMRRSLNDDSGFPL